MDLTPFCPRFHLAVEIIGRRWTGAIVRAMLSGRTRFSDIREVIPGLSDRLLTERLRELETTGVIRREVFPEHRVRVEYTLTDKGRALGDAVEALSNWADAWIDLEAEPAQPAGPHPAGKAVH